MQRIHRWGLLGLFAALQGCVMQLPPPPPPPPPCRAEGPLPPPPPPFMRACEGKEEGASLQITGPRGEPISGTCRRAPNGQLVFMPAPPH